MDIGHPLVRRLIEEVKQSGFREKEHYGRTAYIVTPEVKEVREKSQRVMFSNKGLALEPYDNSTRRMR